MDGLLIDIDPMADGVGILYLGIDPTDCEKIVKRFTLKLESDRGTIQQLHLEYAFSDSLDAYQKKIHWEDVPLFQECLTFTVKDDEISVDMTNSGVAEITNELAETPNDVRFTWEDLQGDIEADLQILCYYNSTETREIIRNLEKLLYGLQEIPLKHALSSLQEQERKLTPCITRTQEDVQKYQDAFLEKS